MTTMNMFIEKKARKSGGDKYTTVDGSFSIYVPQSISREGGVFADAVTVTIERRELEKEG